MALAACDEDQSTASRKRMIVSVPDEKHFKVDVFTLIWRHCAYANNYGGHDLGEMLDQQCSLRY